MISHYNKKIGFYKNYYNSIFSSYILPYSNKKTTHKLFHDDLLYNIHYLYSCLIIYPIIYKRLCFFTFPIRILKRKRMRNRLNLNQTVLIEGTISRKKCFLSVPIFSFLNKIKF